MIIIGVGLAKMCLGGMPIIPLEPNESVIVEPIRTNEARYHAQLADLLFDVWQHGNAGKKHDAVYEYLGRLLDIVEAHHGHN